MKKRALLATPVALFGLAAVGLAAARFHSVRPREFDPAKTYLVQAEWLSGIGCPTGAKTAPFLPPDFTEVGEGTYTDPACLTGDRRDKRNEGLLLVKTGPTNNNAAAVATLHDVKGMTLTELGYDIRKAAAPGSPLGSHCGAGAPRFNVETEDGFFFIGCNSPPGTPVALSNGWTRLRWGAPAPLMGFQAGVLVPVTGEVERITIIFDEGQDTGPDFFGGAVLDNIDVNGVLVGRGADGERGNGDHDDHDDDDHDDDDHDDDDHDDDDHDE